MTASARPSLRRAAARPLPAAAERELRALAGHCICGNLRMAARLVTSHYDAALKPAGIEANQMAMLWVVFAGERLTAQEVAHGTGIDQSTASRNLAVLAARGLVRMVPAPADRRQRIVTLTREGQRALACALPLWRQAQADLAALMTDLVDLEGVGRTLRRVTRRMQASAAGSEP